MTADAWDLNNAALHHVIVNDIVAHGFAPSSAVEMRSRPC